MRNIFQKCPKMHHIHVGCRSLHRLYEGGDRDAQECVTKQILNLHYRFGNPTIIQF